MKWQATYFPPHHNQIKMHINKTKKKISKKKKKKKKKTFNINEEEHYPLSTSQDIMESDN